MTRTRSFELPDYRVSDEAAAYIADTLMQIALQFEATHFAQIRPRTHCALSVHRDGSQSGFLKGHNIRRLRIHDYHIPRFRNSSSALKLRGPGHLLGEGQCPRGRNGKQHLGSSWSRGPGTQGRTTAIALGRAFTQQGAGSNLQRPFV